MKPEILLSGALCIPVMPKLAKTHSKSPVAIDGFKLRDYPKTTFDLE